MLLASLVPLVIVPQAQIKLEFMPPIGKTYHYRMTIASKIEMPGGAKTASPMNFSMTTEMEMKAISRAHDTTTMQSHSGAPKMNFPAGSPMAGMMKAHSNEVKTAIAHIDRHYGVHQTTGSASAMTNAFSGMSFPTHALRIGDTWDTSVDVAKIMGGMGGGAGASFGGKFTMRNRLAAIRHVGGATLAIIAITTDSTIPVSAGGQSNLMHITGQGSASVDLATGMYESMTMPMDMTMAAQGQSFKMSMSESMTRV